MFASKKDRITIGTGDAMVFLMRGPTIQKRWANTCSDWFLFFSNQTPTSSLVKNNISQGVWIKKDRRTIGTGDAMVFLMRGPTIQKTLVSFGFIEIWQAWSQNKNIWTGVGLLCLNYFLCGWMKSKQNRIK